MPRHDFDFDSLTELHDSVNQLLHSPSIQLEIIQRGHEKWAHEVSDASLKMADSCSAEKDLLLLAREHLQNIQSSFRRIAAGNSTAPENAAVTFAPHRLPRKQLKKAILKRIHSLKAMKKSTFTQAGDEVTLVAVVNLLREVRSTTLSIVRSLMSLIAISKPDSDSGRKDPVFRIKLTRVDSLSLWEKCHVSDVRSAMKRLEEVEMVVEDMEAELEEMLRRLIRTRASLLNVLTS